MTSQKLNWRQAQWALYLLHFDFTLKYVSGKSMGKANGLSQRADWQEGVEKDNENRTLIKPEWVSVMIQPKTAKSLFIFFFFFF